MAETEHPLPHIDTIVAAVDGSELSTYGLRVAAQIAVRDEARVIAVHVIHVAQTALGLGAMAGTADTGEFYEAARQVAREARDSATMVLGGAGLTGWTYEERSGPPVDELVAAVKEHHADLVVVGSHGHGPIYDMLVGSVAQGLLRDAPASVLVARPQPK